MEDGKQRVTRETFEGKTFERKTFVRLAFVSGMSLLPTNWNEMDEGVKLLSGEVFGRRRWKASVPLD